jgi:hypothetical protein
MSEPREIKPRDIQDSHHDASGDMGVSSEREGPTGPGQHGTDGVRDVTEERPADEDAPPEQRPGGVEENPEGVTPKAGYSRTDPRSD